MKFGRLPPADAIGGFLAHGLRAGPRRFKKGHVLTGADAAERSAAGITEVLAARLEPGDVAEDEAAGRIATACLGPGARANAPFTGRCNLYAERAGLAAIDRRGVARLNRVDEAITLATVPPFEVVEAGQMLATVKIIPFAAPEAAVNAACALAAETGLIGVAEMRAAEAGLILTRLPETKAGVLAKTEAVLAGRLAALGSRLAETVRADHHEAAVAAAIAGLRARGRAPILIFGASAITDRRDVVPAGLALAGGAVDHFGMPVDPGNLMMLGHVDDVAVVGVPGCARSPKLNGFDWVLRRLLAGFAVTPDDVTAMGAGGLLKEITSRPQPRAGDAPAPKAPRVPRIAAVVLAAGQSRRMGAENKLLAEIEGVAMVARVVDAAVASQADPVIVVTGHQAAAVETALSGRAITLVHNSDYAAGLSTSLRAGLARVPGDADGALICLGDMPRVRASVIDRLIAAFNPVEGRAICVPTKAGKRGNPVLWARRFFADMQTVAGDVGARHLIGEHGDQVAEVAIDDDAIFVDIDTPEALRNLRHASKG